MKRSGKLRQKKEKGEAIRDIQGSFFLAGILNIPDFPVRDRAGGDGDAGFILPVEFLANLGQNLNGDVFAFAEHFVIA